ncbi:MAG: outer membrane protein assembly factor BamA [Verrucomicrobia bacterium]|nr:outer membrane protein assembly factor BamA [Verrucomicrobiota bacterium]
MERVLSILLRGPLVIALACLLAGPARSQIAEGRIKGIAIEHIGPPACSDALIRSNIRVKEGDLYTRNSVDDDVRSLYATGYFYNIQVTAEPEADGLRLVYKVQGKPTLTQILFTGNQALSDSKLRKKLSSKVGEPLDERKLFNDRQEILKRYQKAGRQKTKVEYVPVIDARLGKGTVTFEITEAPKVKIDDVQFIGAEAFKQGKLRRVIKTRRHWMFSWLTGSGKLKDEVFEEDRERLVEFYRDAGYIDFEIKDVQFEEKSPAEMIIKFFVSEGRQYRVGSVALEGNKLFPTEEILARVVVRDKNKVYRGLQTGAGAIFTPKGLARDREGIEDFYGARGYIDARVTPSRIPNIEQGTIDLVYRISEGDKSFIERIEIRGNTKTKDKVLRRELAVNPGEVFDMVRVRVSTNRLYGLNYFAKVDASPEPTDVPTKKDLVIGVEEKNTGDLRLGAGFSSLDGLVGFLEIGQANSDALKWPYFFSTGGGQKLRLRTQFGTRRQDYVLTFIEPWFLGRKLSFSLDLFYRQLGYYSKLYDQSLGGGKVGLRRTLWNDFWIGGLDYTIENVGYEDMPATFQTVDADGNIQTVDPVPPEVRREEGYTLVSKVGSLIGNDTRNSVLLPSRGGRTYFMTEYAGGPLGGDADFYKLELSASRYFRGFLQGHIIELTGRIGVVDTHSGDEFVHLYDKFYLGGMWNLRGYDFRDVGPRDSTYGSEPVGGGTMWFASIEYSIPIIERIRFAVFYDIGNVYPEPYSFKTAGPDYGAYSDDVGIGIRLNIPGLGPMRLDYAIPMTYDKKFNDGDGRFQFGIGWNRDL